MTSDSREYDETVTTSPWTRRRTVPGGYWKWPIFFIVGGFLLFEFGIPFLLLGLVLAVLGPFRRRTIFFRTAVSFVVAFLACFFLTAPFACTTAPSNEAPRYVCTGVIPVTYQGTDPSLWPVTVVSLLFGALVGILIWSRSRRNLDQA